MQISKVLLLFCTCVLAAALNVHAQDQDNAAQATARQALAAKLFEMDAQSPPATNAPAAAPAPKVKPAPVVKMKPAPAPKSVIDDVPPAKTVPSNGPVMVPVGGDTTLQNVDAKQAAAIKAQEDAAAKAQARVDANKAADDAKAKKLAEKEAKKQHDAEVAAAEKQAKLNTDAAMKPPQPAPVVAMPDVAAPPAPVSATKQQQLADLLSKYQADQITPDEYQKQRADILAQP